MLYHSEAPRKPLDSNLVPLLCELTSLVDDTDPGGASSLHLPTPQAQANGEEQIIMIALKPRLKGHITRGYVRGAPIVAQLIDERLAILDVLGYADLPLLKRGNRREHEIAFWDRPITVRPIGTLEGGV